MIKITLLNGQEINLPSLISGFEIATKISPSLAKSSLAMKLDGKLYDLDTKLERDCHLEFITTESQEGLEIIRHDAAHILAQAIKDLYPQAQITIGPVIEDGFYYDIALEEKISSEDLGKIEKVMKDLVKKGGGFTRKVVNRAEAIKIFSDLGEKYKVEIIKDLPEQEEISLYYQGDFCDLCRGPHGPNLKHLKAFKLTKISGAYWRGDSKNPVLQRIYGTAWRNQEELDLYIKRLEEAAKRDHRLLGQTMDLFHFQEDNPGVVFWHNNGWELFQTLVDFIRKRQKAAGYIEVNTPELLARSLWEKSGHWEKFKENMFTAAALDEDREFAIKPMSCPGAVQIYNHGLKSYRDLPIRMAEFGKVHRFEPSGALHGLMRVRGFTQDDAHIFCSEEEIEEESKKVCDFALKVYKDCGFDKIKIKISDRPEKRIGSDEIWDKSEAALKKALEALDLDYSINKGEGAFYGPKVEFTLTDALGRDWQIGTLQVDFNLPARFNASYIDSDGNKKTPVMLHRAILGSLERFIGIILEDKGGKLPLWLAPVQLLLVTVSENFNNYAEEVLTLLKEAGIKAELDKDNQTLNYKLRKHILARKPLIGIIGNNEVVNKTITLRFLDKEEQESISLENLLIKLKKEVSYN
jgi:threonyl-tRNA synthetase